MANAAPSGRRPKQERVDTVTEVGLFLVAEQRELSAKRMQKLHAIARLEDADQIQRERVRNRVLAARLELREALVDQARTEEIIAEVRGALKEVLELEEEGERATAEGERELASTGAHAGAAYIHPDLLQARVMVEEQKAKAATAISPAEAQTL